MKKLLPFLCASALALSLTACAGTINNSTEDTASNVTFTFTDSGVTAAGETDTGYEIDGTALTITSSGTYTVSGSCADGSIKVKKSTTGVTLAAGQYLVTFVSDANVAAAGTLGAALELGGAALPYAVTAETQDAAGADRITLTAIVTPTTAQPLTVINSSGSSNTYTNSTLTIVKLA